MRTLKEKSTKLLRGIEDSIIAYNAFAYERGLPQLSFPYDMQKARKFYKKLDTALLKKKSGLVNRVLEVTRSQAKGLGIEEGKSISVGGVDVKQHDFV